MNLLHRFKRKLSTKGVNNEEIKQIIAMYRNDCYTNGSSMHINISPDK